MKFFRDEIIQDLVDDSKVHGIDAAISYDGETGTLTYKNLDSALYDRYLSLEFVEIHFGKHLEIKSRLENDFFAMRIGKVVPGKFTFARIFSIEYYLGDILLFGRSYNDILPGSGRLKNDF